MYQAGAMVVCGAALGRLQRPCRAEAATYRVRVVLGARGIGGAWYKRCV